MRRLFACLSLVALTGCAADMALPTNDSALRDRLKNPLYAEYYYDDLTEQMLNLALREDPLLEDGGIRNVVDRTRTNSLQKANDAEKKQNDGAMGPFLSDREIAFGEALYIDNVLYFGPTFDVAAGPSLQVYMTHLVDPRDGDFPDPTAVHLGLIKDNYGSQSYSVPVQEGTGSVLRTVVLYDEELTMIYGFAQLATVGR